MSEEKPYWTIVRSGSSAYIDAAGQFVQGFETIVLLHPWENAVTLQTKNGDPKTIAAAADKALADRIELENMSGSD